MKILNGAELAGYIKERQLKQVRALVQAWKVKPTLAILRTALDNPVIDTYVRLKSEYGEDIGVKVDIYDLSDDEILSQIEKLNKDNSVHGIIAQLPLNNLDMTDEVINRIIPSKDVDGLCNNSLFTPATALAIDWLTAGYNIDLTYRKIVIVGNGRLVGSPLAKLWKSSGYNVTVCDSSTLDLDSVVKEADVIVSATGVPGIIKNNMVKKGAIVIDAGVASEHGQIVGDVAPEVRERDDITITPIKGGVGPLTVTALFDNVINSAKRFADIKRSQELL